MSQSRILSIENLHVTRANKPVVHGISFQIKQGEITTLLGANGAGKSSAVLALAGAIACASGQILLGYRLTVSAVTVSLWFQKGTGYWDNSMSKII